MPHPIERLSNGIKLVHKQVESQISHFGVLINAGTRDEDENHLGLAHFVEHTAFKGTTKRNGGQIIRCMENVGGDLNASTSKEETYFHVSFLTEDAERAIELLADIFFNATFPEKELEKEKDVILEEINYYRDTPTESIFDDYESLVYENHPLGRNILGTKKSLKSLHQNVIFDFIKNNYTLNNVVLSYVGSNSLAKIKRYCEKYFSVKSLQVSDNKRLPFTTYQKRELLKHKNTVQTHIVFGNIAYSLSDDKRYPLLLLTNLLGGPGLNTRLNIAIREKRGLAYSVEANYTSFSDSGLITFYIGCDPQMKDRCLDVAYKEINKIRKEALGTLQLHYAKRQLLGQLAISNEAKLNEMISLGRSALFFDEIETIEEAVSCFNSISANDLIEVANEVLDIDQFSLIMYGKI